MLVGHTDLLPLLSVFLLSYDIILISPCQGVSKNFLRFLEGGYKSRRFFYFFRKKLLTNRFLYATIHSVRKAYGNIKIRRNAFLIYVERRIAPPRRAAPCKNQQQLLYFGKLGKRLSASLSLLPSYPLFNMQVWRNWQTR